MSSDILERIVAARRRRVVDAGRGQPAAAAAWQPIARQANPFLAAVAARPGAAVIAEVKLGSPTLGSLQERIDPERQALRYAEAGAACLSVVVEPDFFFGSYELLARCRKASGLPAVAKDFVVDLCQLDWAAEAGAAVILLVASLYRDHDELAAWAAAARGRGLVPLIETHDASDLAKLGVAEWELVGVNNRDLTTFSVGIETSERLAPSLPPGALWVSESGIKSRTEVERLADIGFSAFLIGESLLLADDPGAKLRELLGAAE